MTVSLTAHDDAGGSGIEALRYSTSGAVTTPEQADADGTATITIAAAGETTITFAARDAAGNTETAQTRVVRIDGSAPDVTAAASPASIWPPNGKLVDATISGKVGDQQPIAAATYHVIDEYGAVQPSGSIAVDASGAYSFTLNLPAQRSGNDKDGRTFTIVVTAADGAGNTGQAMTTVVVLHDQGKR